MRIETKFILYLVICNFTLSILIAFIFAIDRIEAFTLFLTIAYSILVIFAFVLDHIFRKNDQQK